VAPTIPISFVSVSLVKEGTFSGERGLFQDRWLWDGELNCREIGLQIAKNKKLRNRIEKIIRLLCNPDSTFRR
jgi:hypothetical protein